MADAPAVTVRRATPADQTTIRRLVRGAQLDPTALHWSHFVVAEIDGAGSVGIGQVRPYPRCPELGSLVVRKRFRGRGIAAAIIHALLESEPGTVYLECQVHMVPYYERFGFQEIPWYRAPMPLKLKAGMGALLGRLFGFRIAAMQREGVESTGQ